MNAKRKLFLLILVLGLLAGTSLFPQSALATDIDYQDYGTGGSGGGTCTYCSLPNCGCPTGMNFTCACSSIWCARSCSY